MLGSTYRIQFARLKSTDIFLQSYPFRLTDDDNVHLPCVIIIALIVRVIEYSGRYELSKIISRKQIPNSSPLSKKKKNLRLKKKARISIRFSTLNNHASLHPYLYLQPIPFLRPTNHEKAKFSLATLPITKPSLPHIPLHPSPSLSTFPPPITKKPVSLPQKSPPYHLPI